VDGTRFERPDDVDREPTGQHRHPVLEAGDRYRVGDGEVEVGAGQEQPVPVELGAHAPEHGQAAAPTRSGAPGGGQGLDEHVSFATELHVLLSFFREIFSDGNRCCGLWMTSHRRRSRRLPVPAGRPQARWLRLGHDL
jgi:hypothetical protein